VGGKLKDNSTGMTEHLEGDINKGSSFSELERKAMEMGIVAEEYLKQLLKRKVKQELVQRHMDPKKVLKAVHGNNCSPISDPSQERTSQVRGKNSRTKAYRYE
jgi:hypothetical protein